MLPTKNYLYWVGIMFYTGRIYGHKICNFGDR